MMDRKNQNEHEILNMKGSRFSGEERARMVQLGNSARKRNYKSPSADEKAAKKPQGSATGKRSQPAPRTGSRNDAVRSSAKQRKKDKKRQNNLLGAMLFLVAVAGIAIACVLVLKINTVEVINGSDTYSDESIIAQSGIEEGDSMLLINTEAASADITTKLPFVETAVIERQWPDKVVITVEYAETAMVIDSGSGYILLNSSCKVLDDDAPVFTDMAAQVRGVSVLSAVPGQRLELQGDITADALTSLARSVEENSIENVTLYDLSKITDVVLMVDRRIEVKLGTLASAPDKLGFCREVIKRSTEEDSKHAMVIDFSADGTAYARVKKDNHVNYEDETLPFEEIPEESTGGNTVTENGAVTEETTASFSVG